MCTAIRYGNCFCRNLDYYLSYNEQFVFMPRNYPFHFRHRKSIYRHYAILGIGIEAENFPLYFDAVNEKGLAMAGLNFPKDALYRDQKNQKENIASFEFIPYILSKCKSVSEARELIKNVNITNTPFSVQYPPAPLHWIVADKESSIVVESTKNSLKIHRNPTDILTNSPSFDVQLFNLTNYSRLSAKATENTFSKKLTLPPYSFGMGALGLPGDLSSCSRFVRACFFLHNSPLFKGEEAIAHSFKLLNSVAMPKGSVICENDEFEYTRYSAVIDTESLKYHYSTYNSFNVKSLSLFDFDTEQNRLISLEK